jgi:hypothetical protein
MAADHSHWTHTTSDRSDELLRGDAEDQRQVRDRLARIGYDSPTDFDACLGCATRFFKRPDVWQIVDQVATALVASAHLTKEQLRPFANATPKIDPNFWDFMKAAVEFFRAGG